MRERQRFDVARQVVHRHDRQPPRPAERFGERHADEEGPDQTRSLGHGDGADVVQPDAAAIEGSFDDAAHVAHVLP